MSNRALLLATVVVLISLSHLTLVQTRVLYPQLQLQPLQSNEDRILHNPQQIKNNGTMSHYTQSQQLALFLVPKLTGSIGILCSSFTATEIVRDYHRTISRIHSSSLSSSITTSNCDNTNANTNTRNQQTNIGDQSNNNYDTAREEINTTIDYDHENDDIVYEMTPMKRALFGCCCYDIMDSFGWMMSGLFLPSSYDFLFSIGSQGSCSFQGFLLQIAIGSPLCSAMITLFFYLIVAGSNFRQQEERQQQQQEPIPHGIVSIENMDLVDSDGRNHNETNNNDNHIVTNAREEKDEYIDTIEWKLHYSVAAFAFVSSILMIPLEQYNPSSPGTCWILGNPWACGNSFIVPNPYLPCERGDYAYLYSLILFYIPLWCTIIVVILLNIAMRRILIREDNVDDAVWITNQALLYSTGFFITWTPTTLSSIFAWMNIGSFWLDIAAAICEPLQGLWNLVIFVRDRPHSIRRIQSILRFQQCCYDCYVPCCNRHGDIRLDDTNVATNNEQRRRNSNSSKEYNVAHYVRNQNIYHNQELCTTQRHDDEIVSTSDVIVGTDPYSNITDDSSFGGRSYPIYTISNPHKQVHRITLE